MSNCTLQHTMIRIAGAPPESPIAVLRTTAPGKLNAVFADTLLTKEIITGESTSLIGVFDKTMDMETVRQHLHTHVPKKRIFMKKNVSHFGPYFWIKNLVTTRLVRLGYSPAEIRAAVLHAVHLLAQGNNAARAFYISSVHAAHRRAAKLMLPF